MFDGFLVLCYFLLVVNSSLLYSLGEEDIVSAMSFTDLTSLTLDGGVEMEKKLEEKRSVEKLVKIEKSEQGNVRNIVEINDFTKY